MRLSTDSCAWRRLTRFDFGVEFPNFSEGILEETYDHHVLVYPLLLDDGYNLFFKTRFLKFNENSSFIVCKSRASASVGIFSFFSVEKLLIC